MRYNHTLNLTLLPLILVLVLSGGYSESAWSGDVPAGAITRRSGSVVVRKMGAEAEKDAPENTDIYVSDRLMTRQDGRVQLALQNGSFLDLDGDTAVRINHYSLDPKQGHKTIRIKLLNGSVRAVFLEDEGPSSFFHVETEHAAILLQPRSVVVVHAETSSTELMVLRGEALVRNVNTYIVGSILTTGGYRTTVQSGRVPLPPRVLTPGERKKINDRFE